MSSATPHHRHQTSLEGVIDFSPEPPLGPTQRINARRRFYHIVEHFEALGSNNSSGRKYSQPRLIRFTYEYALSEESRDIFLRAFFRSMALSLDGHEEPDCEELGPLFVGFAEYLMDSFFLPLKTTTNRTPQPSPAYHSAVQRAQGGGAQAFTGTPDRLSSLRGACLVRDRHRCVISQKFSTDEFEMRSRKHGDDACDDDGVLLSEEDHGFDTLEVAHILPHSLTKTSASAELDEARKAAVVILNMFDSGVAHIIEGTGIDRPRNAITLAPQLHRFFGAFKIYFDPLEGEYNMYQIQSFLSPQVSRAFGLPVTRTLFVTDTHTIDPPSPRLLAVHRAIAHILHLSGAGEYIEKLLRDVEENCVQSDGSTELGRLVSLGLGGWLDGAVYS